MYKIFFAHGNRLTREYYLIKQGLENHSNIKLVNNEEDSDFVFYLYYTRKKNQTEKPKQYDPEKTVVIDFHDNPHWLFDVKCKAYFKRSWLDMKDKGIYTTRKSISWPEHFHPISFAIMDEFIIEKEYKRNCLLSCTLKANKKNLNRYRVLNLLKTMNLKGNIQIGKYNKGAMKGWLDDHMKDYFRHLKKSRIVVTCNPGKWEGDHRTWEAFANGALVIVDRMHTPLEPPLIDGRHCFFYEPTNRGLRRLREIIEYFMKDIKLAERIANQGHEFTMEHHRSVNRIDEILRVIT